MDKPPLSLFFPTYVVEYAVVDATVKFMNRRTLNVGGKWLGAVAKLAICKNVETSEFHLAHCNEDWEDLAGVQTADSLQAIKEIAERQYQGIGSKWSETNYDESEAVALLEAEKEAGKCSFCGKSHFEAGIRTMISGDKARICDSCIRSLYEELQGGES